MRTLAAMMITLAPLLLSTAARAETTDKEQDADRIAACNFLWGYGVDFVEDEAAGTVTLKYDAKTTHDQARRWTRDYYRPALEQAYGWAGYDAEVQLYDILYRDAVKKGWTGWILSEPFAIREVCRAVGGGISDAAKRAKQLQWCDFTSALFADSNRFEFRGREISYARDTSYGGDTELSGEIWKTDDDVVVIVPGSFTLAGAGPKRARVTLLGQVPAESPFFQKAQAQLAKEKEWIAKQETAVAALEQKQAGAAGNKVVFAERTFDPWDPVEAVTEVESCQNVFWKAYGPAGAAAKEVSYDWQVSVDGNECARDWIQVAKGGIAKTTGGPVFTGAGGDCSKHLVAAGKHEIAVQLFTIKHVKTGTWEYVTDGAKTIKKEIERKERVKAIVTGKLSCRTAGDTLRKAYDPDAPR